MRETFYEIYVLKISNIVENLFLKFCSSVQPLYGRSSSTISKEMESSSHHDNRPFHFRESAAAAVLFYYSLKTLLRLPYDEGLTCHLEVKKVL